MNTYRVQWTTEAREALETLPAERVALIERAVRVLARDPFVKAATAAIGPDENQRKAYVAPGILLEYLVGTQFMVVVVISVFDEAAYLIDESDAR